MDHTGPIWALQAQHELARWWGTEPAFIFAQNFGESMDAKGGSRRAGLRDRNARDMPATQVEAIPKMTTYSVSRDMVTLIEAAASSFPGQALHEHDLPSPSGFVYLDRPIELLDVREQEVDFKAFTWELADVQRVETDGTLGPIGPGIFLAMYSSLENVVNYDSKLSPSPTMEEAEEVFGRSGLALLHIHGIMFDHEYDLTGVAILQNHLAFIESLFAIMQQRIATTTQEHMPRQIRRGVERNTGQTPDVRRLEVITLRRMKTPAGEDVEEEPGYVDWSHR